VRGNIDLGLVVLIDGEARKPVSLSTVCGGGASSAYWRREKERTGRERGEGGEREDREGEDGVWRLTPKHHEIRMLAEGLRSTQASRICIRASSNERAKFFLPTWIGQLAVNHKWFHI
jgi:hypothetical protein